ncbi:Phospholipase D beta 1 [Glycine soja]|uniref:phospholipase D n=1 Tax=Glycine soja TaxID=3848 RepID=A0A445L6F1_GLYSO|nr:Phospholipase D beta 1 [Glycine soja]
MDNYGSLQHPYGYPNPPHDLYAQPPYPYPYPPNPPYTNNFNYSYPPPPPPPHSSSPYSSHIDYSSYPPPPSTSSHGSFDYPMPQPPHTYLYPNEFYSYSSNSSSSLDQEDPSRVSDNSDDSVHSQSLQIVPAQLKGSLRVMLLHGNLDIWVHGATNLPNMDMFHKTLEDMFGRLPGNVQHFYNVPVAHHAAEVHFVVKDSDVVGSQLIGVVAIPVEQIYSGNGKPCKPGAVLTVSIQYIPMEKLTIKGGTVTLYQDAHVPNGCLPNVVLENGMYCAHGQSKSSEEGVRVLLLVWDDPTSRNILGYKVDGVMATRDEETRRFFKHSSMQVLLCPRIAGKRNSWVKQQFYNFSSGTIYTHHQKTVIVDADAGNNKRKIVAFVGGLDLCDGRYDTPHLPMFRTLQTLHKDDYHNPTFTGNTGGCPREPWHDLHSKIDGPAAYDILKNFEERWLRAAKPKGIQKIRGTISASNAPSVGDDNPESWHVQIFRSIDSNSVKGFPKEPKNASSMNLVCGKNVLIDMSIHTAYVKAIRVAQHYIYIENQYFIGSSYNWSQHKDLGANNLIPMEIALKIAAKIRANERFAGVPTGAATQRILFWQHKTMQMMYETIYKALVEVGLEAAFSPQDYLIFFCLGNREAIDMYENITVSGTPPPANTVIISILIAFSRTNPRFMIYVRSKGMIVDDEYVILGSANINQRSIEGTRDTEIAMGAYQPHHTWARRQYYPRGQDKVRSLPGHEEFPDVGGKIVGSFIAIQENLTI